MRRDPLSLLNAELRSRAVSLNDHGLHLPADYVLVWLQQTLRGKDHPTIDAGVEVANSLGLSVLVYHGLGDDYPYASDRLHRFILGASREMSATLARRGITCVQHVVRPTVQVRGLVYKLAENAACVFVDRHATFVGKLQADRFAAKVSRAVFAVDATRLVPHDALPAGLEATRDFRAAHVPMRDFWLENRREIVPQNAPYDGPLPFTPDRLVDMNDADIDALISSCAIDHGLPAHKEFPATGTVVASRLSLAAEQIVPRYKWTRNNPADPLSGSKLSPYLHFGMTSPFAVLRSLDTADVSKSFRWKFLDELLTWREWCHWRIIEIPDLMMYHSLPAAARQTLEAHANDPRAVLPLDALVHGDTPDETWNAAQRQWLTTGWMHNNLRMYWAKQLLRWTPSPQAAWATGCYLNDRLSLDGRDPSTYVMMRWAFGEGRRAYKELPVYGRIPMKGDTALRKRPGAAGWLATMASAEIPSISVPDYQTIMGPYATG